MVAAMAEAKEAAVKGAVRGAEERAAAKEVAVMAVTMAVVCCRWCLRHCLVVVGRGRGFAGSLVAVCCEGHPTRRISRIGLLRIRSIDGVEVR